MVACKHHRAARHVNTQGHGLGAEHALDVLGAEQYLQRGGKGGDGVKEKTEA